MSIINNDNFDRDTKLDPATLNDKFTDVATATASIDENNVRNSGIDAPQFDTTPTHGKQGVQLVAIAHDEIGAAAAVGQTFPHGSVNAITGMGTFNMTVAVPGGALEGDILRVYWHTESSKSWAVPSVQARRKCWAQSLRWRLGGGAGAYVDVPGQGNYSTTAFGSFNGVSLENCNGSNFIHHASILDNGSTAIANVAPTEAVLAGTNRYVENDVGAANRLMSTGAWFHEITAPEASTAIFNFQLGITGTLTPIYDNTTSKNYLVTPAVAPAGSLTITIYKVNITAVLMRSK